MLGEITELSVLAFFVNW